MKESTLFIKVVIAECYYMQFSKERLLFIRLETGKQSILIGITFKVELR